ncbi:U6 snRNA phosphodiesterase 1 [Toxorhynchites rutilus septentrionalis]|uniref:U6 snRNA phosphodiesterase 1 n=1 Tax=Toxorhynchites rutilus septentrionalis TaxID=329112 RepID=UPI00247A81DB|nr:U6 snRNA phosphodiesterase 1 [Toxorhynchites rutilus septentrionalis]
MYNILQYTSSDSEEDDQTRTQDACVFTQAMTPASPPEPENDTSRHQGRIRSFPHERGIWASYVYVDYNDIDAFSNLQLEIITKAANDLNLELNRVDNMHMSLTKTFVLRHHNIPTFVENLRAAIRGSKRFTILLSELAVYTNAENTRTFLAARIHDNSFKPLELLVEKLDACLAEYKLPEFYKDPSFHVSFLWTLGNQRKLLEDNLQALQQTFAAIYEEEYCEMNIMVKQLHLKCGNKFHDFDLL